MAQSEILTPHQYLERRQRHILTTLIAAGATPTVLDAMIPVLFPKGIVCFSYYFPSVLLCPEHEIYHKVVRKGWWIQRRTIEREEWLFIFENPFHVAMTEPVLVQGRHALVSHAYGIPMLMNDRVSIEHTASPGVYEMWGLRSKQRDY